VPTPGALVRRLVLVAGRGLHAAAAVVAALAGGLATLVRSPFVAVGRLGAFLARLRRGVDHAGERATDSTAAHRAGEDDPERTSVRTAWRVLVALVPVSGVAASRMTPAELAERGVAAGLPRGPVEWLRDAYRDVTYGGRDPDAEDRRRRAAAVVSRLREDHEEGDAAADREEGADEGRGERT
jgi:hypothetical protein